MFTLRIENAPSGSKYWYTTYTIVGVGIVASPWMNVATRWDSVYRASGETNLIIQVVDSGYNETHYKSGLGPIYNDHDYVYDCSTGVLSEEGQNGENAEGHLENPSLYIYGIGNVWERELPYTLYLDSYSANAYCNVINDTDYPQNFKMTIEIIDPDGVSHGKDVDIAEIGAGVTKTISSHNCDIGDKEGIWKIHAILESAMILDEKTWDAVTVLGGPEPDSGKITATHFYNPVTKHYQIAPPAVNLSQKVGLYALADNFSGTSQTMRLRVELYDPDGILLDSDEREMDIDYPGTIGSHDVEGTATKLGEYTAKVDLWVAGGLVDSKTVKVATARKEGVAFPWWAWVITGVGAVGIVAAFKKKKG